MNYEIAKKVGELQVSSPVRIASALFFDDFADSTQFKEVDGEHLIGADLVEIYKRRLAIKGSDSIGGESLQFAAQSFGERVGRRTKTWLVETGRFVGYVFLDIANGQIIAAPYCQRKKPK
jgi:hypothetical protein